MTDDEKEYFASKLTELNDRIDRELARLAAPEHDVTGIRRWRDLEERVTRIERAMKGGRK
jgi:hypothetical protein